MILDNVLFIDIETVSVSRYFHQLDSRWQPLVERKLQYFKEREPEKSIDQIYQERAAIYAEFGKVVCIGVAFVRGDQLRIKTFAGPDEEVILSDFFELLGKYFYRPEKHRLCGHNIREFDIPFLCRRATINGLQLPALLQIAGRKPWEIKHLVDTMELWKFGDIKHFTSLDLLAACLGLESPKTDMDGSQVGRVFYEDQDLERIAAYCAQDVWVTANVFLAMHQETPFSWDQVVY